MSFWETHLSEITLWTWCRSLSIAIVAWPIVRCLNRGLASVPQSYRMGSWIALLIPFFTPGLLVGYAYGRGFLALREWQGWNEGLYFLLSLARWVPLGVMIVRSAPPSEFSEAAWHCWKMAAKRERSVWQRLRENCLWHCQGEEKKYLLAAAVIFLAAFHEFELAALMGVTSWNVWLFDAQSGGLVLSESFRRLAIPVILQVLTVGPILLLAGRGWVSGADSAVAASVRGGSPWLAWGWMVFAGLLGCIVPWSLVAMEGRNGFARIWSQSYQWQGLLREGMNGLLFGGCAAAVVLSICGWLCGGFFDSHRLRFRGRWLCLLPGMFGPLAVSLLCLAVFQSRGIVGLVPAGLSWLAALVLWLIPYGVLLQFAVRKLVAEEAVHLAEMLSVSRDRNQRRAGSKIWWRMRGDGWLWMGAILGYGAYFDLTTASILAPPGSVSAPVRLFNQMHYGQNAMLSALTAGGVLMPLGAMLGILVLRRFLLRGGSS